jgi:predicted NBD/HSP70 family sugar kinase
MFSSHMSRFEIGGMWRVYFPFFHLDRICSMMNKLPCQLQRHRMAQNRFKRFLATAGAGSPASQVIRVLGQNGSMTSAQIARLTGLARSTVSTAVTELKSSNVVVEFEQTPASTGAVGRPGTLLSLNPDAGTCVGVHLGYDSVQVVVADLSHSIIAERSIMLAADYAPGDVTGPVHETFRAFYKSHGLTESNLLGVGVSVSGPVRPDGVLQRGGILPRWAGINIRELFSGVFKRPVLTDNESNCAAVAEMKWGAARGVDDFVLFKMDVGVGGAVVSNGRVVTGVAGGAGEFGHVSINPEGDLCRCGNRGCLELYASFLKPLEQLSKVHRRKMTMDEAIALAEAGDAGALRMIADVADYGGRGLAMIGTMLNPPLILIGGRMALAGDLLLAPMKAAYARHTLIKQHDAGATARTDIRAGKFTENDSLLGAVGLVLHNHLSLPSL